MNNVVLLGDILEVARRLKIGCTDEHAVHLAEFFNQHLENPLESLGLAGDCVEVNDVRIIAALSDEQDHKFIGRGFWSVNVVTKTSAPSASCPVVFTDKQILQWWLLERKGVTIPTEVIRQAYIRDLISTNLEHHYKSRGIIGSIVWRLSPRHSIVKTVRGMLGDTLFFRLPKPFIDYFYNNIVRSEIYYHGVIADMVRHRIVTDFEAELLLGIFELIYTSTDSEVNTHD